MRWATLEMAKRILAIMRHSGGDALSYPWTLDLCFERA